MKIKIPTELHEITLEQVQRVLLIDANPDIEDFPKRIHALAVLTDRTAQEISTFPGVDIDRIYDKLFGMINGIGSAPLTRIIKIKGHTFGFIEDVRDMETGAFVDIDTLSKPDVYAENLHKIMAILYRPIDAQLGKRYRLKSYVTEDPRDREDRQKLLLKYLTLDVVRGAAGFFLQGIQKSSNISGDWSPQLARLTARAAMRGVGSISFTRLREEILQT